MKTALRWLPIAALFFGLAACSGGTNTTALTPMQAAPTSLTGLDVANVAASALRSTANPSTLPPGLPGNITILGSGGFNGTGKTYTQNAAFCIPKASLPQYDPSDKKVYWAFYNTNTGAWMFHVAGKDNPAHKQFCWDADPLNPPITLYSDKVYYLAMYQAE